jgi:hypothetical protein
MASTLTGKQAKARLAELGVDFDGHKETGVLRQIVAHTLGLGILPERCWTPRSVRYTANEILRVPASEEDVGKGSHAKDYLRSLLKKDEVPNPAKNLANEFSMAGMNEDFRKKMQLLFDEEQARVAKAALESQGNDTEDTPEPSGSRPSGKAPKKRSIEILGSFGKAWKDSSTDLAAAYGQFTVGRDPPKLGTDQFDWVAITGLGNGQREQRWNTALD